jgi:hypothetical protein
LPVPLVRLVTTKRVSQPIGPASTRALYHFVESHDAENDGISITFNLYNSGLEWSRFWHPKPFSGVACRH